jgi:hypothetical protein
VFLSGHLFYKHRMKLLYYYCKNHIAKYLLSLLYAPGLF